MQESPRRAARLRRRLALASVAALAAALAVVPQASAITRSAADARLRSADRGVVANLFEWNWNSVARECSTQLGPAGYAAVQVSPPHDSIKRTELGNGSDTILHPWWEVYQPVDYRLTSRMGDEREFRAMVSSCRRAGVKIYVDAVINHMTGQGSVSYGGVSFGRYDYPGLYGPQDFHASTGDCPSATGGIEDFNNKQQVFTCELLGLADLRTETDKVRATLAAYLNRLISYGVSGFRVDAAKHIGQRDLDAIYARLRRTREGTRPLWALEVFGGGPGVLAPGAFVRSGTVLGLDGVKQLKSAFKSYPPDATGSIATLEAYGEESGLTPGSRTLSFVQNHDTERNGDALSYKDGATNIVATEFILATPYGIPQVFSGFDWTTDADSPPSDPEGIITDTDCGAGWACTHRAPAVRAMVRWHNAVGAAPQRNWWDDGTNVIAFSRGSLGWVALNNGTAAKTIDVQTGLPAGRYCDLISGRRAGAACSGREIAVGAGGTTSVEVAAKGSVAITRSERL